MAGEAADVDATRVLGPTKIVLGDANVLYSRVLRDYLVYAADEGVISIRWSQEILGEVVRNLQANYATFGAEQAALLPRLLNAAYPQAEVKPTASAQRKVKKLDMPDENDRHVLAAAVTANADILCTDNVKDFPPEAMSSVGIELLTADALLSRLATMYPSQMLAAHRTAVSSLNVGTDKSTIAALRRANAAKTADLMEALIKTI